MYVLIADSGSTKTDWVLLNNNTVVTEVKTIGFNPYFQTKEAINFELLNQLKPFISNELDETLEIHYYGTGCSTTENCELIAHCLRSSLGVDKVNVAHDLLAAARALCNNDWGIACILGTGSNSCLYNGASILENVPSTGYLWSDYGGGSQIGKNFIKEYFEGTLPIELKIKFEEAGYNREVILDNVYKKSVPGRYLASVSLFVAKHRDHPFVAMLLDNCFDSFFIHQVNRYSDAKKYKIHTVGSIGFFYQDLISKAAARFGYQMGNVLQSPMEGLIAFHSQNR
jgi:N-acetylglucosamine kinase-like BadF-type ATPase